MNILVHAFIVYLRIFILFKFGVYQYIETEREIEREREGQRQREQERQRDRETERQRDRETERPRDRDRPIETERDSIYNIHRYIYLYTQPCTNLVYVKWI